MTPSSERTMSTTTPVSFSPHHPVSPSSVNELRHQSASRSGLEAAQLHEAKVYGTAELHCRNSLFCSVVH